MDSKTNGPSALVTTKWKPQRSSDGAMVGSETLWLLTEELRDFPMDSPIKKSIRELTDDLDCAKRIAGEVFGTCTVWDILQLATELGVRRRRLEEEEIAPRGH